MSEDEYLALDVSETPLDYVNGEAFECAGARAEHNLVVANVIRALGNSLDGRPCVVLASQQRVATMKTRAFHHPDVVVVCGAIERHPKDRDTITNPTLVIEVLSPTTADYDRGAKFDHLRTIATLDEMLFVSVDERIVEQRRRLPSGEWVSRWYDAGAIDLASVGVALTIEETFAKLELVSS